MARNQDAAARASIALVPYEFHRPDDFEAAFTAFVQAKAEALLVPPDTTFASYRARIAELAVKARLPSIFANRLSAEAGGLLSYGPDPVEKLPPRGRVRGQDFEGRASLPTCRSSGQPRSS